MSLTPSGFKGQLYVTHGDGIKWHADLLCDACPFPELLNALMFLLFPDRVICRKKDYDLNTSCIFVIKPEIKAKYGQGFGELYFTQTIKRLYQFFLTFRSSL